MKYCLFLRDDLLVHTRDIFDAETLYGMKSDMYMYTELKNYLHSQNIFLNTQNIHPPESCEVVICVNETPFFETYKRSSINKLLILILTEPPVYNAKDWNPY
jgi:hypothetical protein